MPTSRLLNRLAERPPDLFFVPTANSLRTSVQAMETVCRSQEESSAAELAILHAGSWVEQKGRLRTGRWRGRQR
jgi:hypothetical protein